jgi:acetyl-CoA C-acetyltransferase
MRDDTPVLIGAGQFTYRGDADQAPTPIDLLTIAAERAAADAKLSTAALSQIDALAVVGFTVDAPGGLERLAFPRLKNPPKSLAKRLGAAPGHAVYSHMGGNSSQQLINHLCERIANGESELGLAVGAEFLGSLMKRLRNGAPFAADYGDDETQAPWRLASGSRARAGLSCEYLSSFRERLARPRRPKHRGSPKASRRAFFSLHPSSSRQS